MKFNDEVSKVEKRHAGHTDVQNTPLEVHSRMELKRGFKEHVRVQIEHALRHNATRVERVEVWFDDLNGPKGGIDTLCRVTLVMGGQPNIIVEERAESAAVALDHLAPRLGRALDKAADRKGNAAPRPGSKGDNET